MGLNTGDFNRWYKGLPSEVQSNSYSEGGFDKWYKGLPAPIQFLGGAVEHTGDYLLKARLLVTNSVNYLLKGTLLKNISDSYLLQAVIVDIVFASYLLKATLHGTVSTTYKLVSTLLGNISSDYVLDAYLIWLKTGSYTLASTLFGTISDTYKLVARLYATVSTNFLLKATVLKHWNLPYILQATLTAIIRRLYISYLTFDVNGALSTGAQQGGTRVISNPNLLTQIYIYLKTPGVAGETIIDINKNGTSIFADPGDRPHIPYNDVNKFDEAPVSVALTKDDKLTIDIDQIATGAADLSVIMHLDTYTGLKPVINKIDFFDDTFKMEKNSCWVTTLLKFKIQWDNRMDNTVTPTITVIKKDGTSSVITGSWTKTRMDDDTYLTSAVSFTESDVGSAKIIVKGAVDKYGITMADYSLDFAIASFNQLIQYNKWTNTAVNNINFYLISEKLSFSLNGATYSSPVDWDDVKAIDITDAAIGGTSAEGVKTLYIKFLSTDGLQSCIKTITIRYYTTAIGSWTLKVIKRQSAEGYNKYAAFIKLPEDAKDMPIEDVKIYQDAVLLEEITQIQKYVFNEDLSLIPIMTGYTTPSGIASAHNEQAGLAWHAVDGVAASGWFGNKNVGYAWWAYEFATAKKVNNYSLFLVNADMSLAMKDWVFQGWDGGSWITLDTQVNQTGWVSGVERNYEFVNNTSYIKYRFYITGWNGHPNWTGFTTVQFYSDVFRNFDYDETYINETARQVTIKSGRYIAANGSYIERPDSETITLNPLVSGDSRFDLVALDNDGNIVVVEGTEGGLYEHLPGLNDLSVSIPGVLYPEPPLVDETYTPLYIFFIYDQDGYIPTGKLAKIRGMHYDLRPTWITKEFEVISGVNTLISVTLEDAGGRTSSQTYTIKLAQEIRTSARHIVAYKDAGFTQPVKSGEVTDATKLYFRMEADTTI